MWRLHMLDFKDGEKFNTPLLWGVTAMTVLLQVTGLVLPVSRLRRDFRNRRSGCEHPLSRASTSDWCADLLQSRQQSMRLR